MLRALLRTLAISLLAAIATNCDYTSSDTTDSGCSGPYGPSEPYVPTPAHWAPVPQSDNLFAIGGDNTTNLVVVGSGGLIVPVNTHEKQDSGTRSNLFAVWAQDGVAFAVGSYGDAARFDGSKWTSIPTNSNVTLNGVWGTGANDVFAVGDVGTVAHWNGFGWAVSTIPGHYRLSSVWGSSSTDVFAVGTTDYPEHSAAFHYDGSTWEYMGYMPGEGLADVWGTSHSDVFAVGASRDIQHYDGRSWGTMLTFESFTNLSAVWGSSSTDVYAVGAYGTLMHYDGSEWSQSRIANYELYDVGGTGAGDVYIVEANNPVPSLLHGDGATWSEETLYVRHGFNAIWAESSQSAYMVGAAGTIVHKGGFTGSSLMRSGTTENLNSVWGNGQSLIAVGDAGTILHHDGNEWSSMQSNTTTTLRDVWSATGAEVYAVGDAGTILQYKNNAWSPMTSGVTANLNAVWGSAANDVYAVGNGGTVVRYNGAQWKVLNPGTKQDLFGVWVGPGGSAVVVGDNGTFLTRASGWHVIPAPPDDDMRAVWGSSFTDIHVVAKSRFLRFDGETVKEIASPFALSGSLTAIHGTTRFDVLAVDDAGSLYQFYVKN